MKVAIVKERRAEELRVAASPDTVKRMAGMGLEVLVEPGAGDGSAFPDPSYEAAGRGSMRTRLAMPIWF